MFLHSTREGDYPNQIQHPENIPHPLQTAGLFEFTESYYSATSWADSVFPMLPGCSGIATMGGILLILACIVFGIKGLYAEQNILIFKVLASFLAGILKLMHHMVNLSNESGQA